MKYKFETEDEQEATELFEVKAMLRLLQDLDSKLRTTVKYDESVSEEVKTYAENLREYIHSEGIRSLQY